MLVGKQVAALPTADLEALRVMVVDDIALNLKARGGPFTESNARVTALIPSSRLLPRLVRAMISPISASLSFAGGCELAEAVQRDCGAASRERRGGRARRGRGAFRFDFHGLRDADL